LHFSPQLGPRTEERETFTRLLGLPLKGTEKGCAVDLPDEHLYSAADLADLVGIVRSSSLSTKETDEAATKLLMDFSYRQARGTPQERVVLAWMADIADRLLDHEDARQVFGLLPRPRGNQGNPEMTLEYAVWVHLATARGLSKVEAIAEASIAFERDESSIRKQIQGEAGRVEQVDEEYWERHFREAGRSLPASGSK
jgi:hypothetical protein